MTAATLIAGWRNRATKAEAERDALAAFVAELLEGGPLSIKTKYGWSLSNIDHYACQGCGAKAQREEDIKHGGQCWRERARKALEGRTT